MGCGSSKPAVLDEDAPQPWDGAGRAGSKYAAPAGAAAPGHGRPSHDNTVFPGPSKAADGDEELFWDCRTEFHDAPPGWEANGAGVHIAHVDARPGPGGSWPERAGSDGPAGEEVPRELIEEDSPMPTPSGIPEPVRLAALQKMRALVLAPSDTAAATPYEDRTDATLERFLRARDFKVPVAAALFLEHRRWRAAFGWSVAASEVEPEFAKGVISLQGCARDGRPFVLVQGHKHFAAGRNIDRLRKYVIYSIDKTINGLPSGAQFIVKADVTKVGMRNHDPAFFIMCAELLQKTYVERIAQIWLLNPPVILWLLLKIVGPFLAAKTRNKMIFLSGAAAQRMMDEYIPPDVLPKEYGGLAPLRPVTAAPAPWEDPATGGRRVRKY